MPIRRNTYGDLHIGVPPVGLVTLRSNVTLYPLSCPMLAHACPEPALPGDWLSIRTIVGQADVNQAAINYHFGSKEELYRAVLQTALRALMKDDDKASHPITLSRETALRRFVRQQLRPMTSRDNLSEYVRIFNWETLRPSPAFRKFMAKEAAPFFSIATDLVRRFLPSEATDQQALLGSLWLFGQCSIFVRNAEHLALLLHLKIDEPFVEALADTIATWAAGGLGRLPTSAPT
jgi:AcrR family transcriptional regulator